MHYINNMGEVFYIYNFKTGKKTRIGTRHDFIKGYLAPSFCNQNGTSVYDVAAYKYRSNIATNPNDSYRKENVEIFKEGDSFYKKIVITHEKAECCYMDGYGRIVNPLDFIDEVYSYKVSTPKKEKREKYSILFLIREDFRTRQHTKSHSGYKLKTNRTYMLYHSMRDESMIKNDPEIKDYFRLYHIKKGKHNVMDWDEGVSKQGSGWKYQHKSNKQYNKHNHSTDSRSIRTMSAFADEYTDDEIDEMLMEEFLEKSA